MKRLYWIGIASMVFLFAGCPTTDNPIPPDTSVELTAGDNVTVSGVALTGMAVFKGKTGFTLAQDLNLETDLKLKPEDFTVSGDGKISMVYVGYDEVKVTVVFTYNPSFTASRSFVVAPKENNPLIKGDAKVTITQNARTKVALTAGGNVNVRAVDTSANVAFSGAADLPLTAADFSVTGGGTVSGVEVEDGTANVEIGFNANATETAKTYTVSIAAASEMITGSATVEILQARVLSEVDLTPATTYIFEDYEGTDTTASWTVVRGQAGNQGAEVAQTIIDDPLNASNKVGHYRGTGSGNRGSSINLAQVISGEYVVAEFDWYPNTFAGGNNNAGPMTIALMDGISTYDGTITPSADRHAHGKRIISFLNIHDEPLKFRLGNFNDGDTRNTLLMDTVDITGTLEKEQWYTFKVIINTQTKMLSRLYVYDKATGATLFETNDLELVGEYSGNVAAIRFYLSRTDNGNSAYLDNVFVGNGERPKGD